MKKELLFSAVLALVGATESFAGNAKAETLNGRSIYVYAPANIEKNKPLLISCHGMNQDAAYQSNQARWEDIADTARFVVVYPNGINKGWDLGGDKDINLVKDIIDEMSKRYQIDLSRVYLSGFSMGGMFTYYAMGKIADKIAAFAPVSGYMMGGPGKAQRPVPIIHHHGTSDDVVTYSNVMTHINAYKNQFNCPANPSETQTFPANSKSEMWGPCDGGVSVKLVTLGGKGHWHSNDEAVVHTSKSIWNFIKNYSLEGSVDAVEPEPQKPFKGTAIAIPGKVEAEDIDIPGVGRNPDGTTNQSFKVGTTENKGDSDYRKGTPVSIYKKATGNVIGYNGEGNWYEYTVDVKADGEYTVYAAVAAAGSTSSFQLSMDGKDISEKVAVPAAAAGEDNYDDYNKVSFNVKLSKGQHILRLTVTGAWFDIDYMTFVAKGEADPEPIEKAEGEKVVCPDGGCSEGSDETAINSRFALSLSKSKTYSIYNLSGAFLGKIHAASFEEIQEKTFALTKKSGVYLVKSAGFIKKIQVSR